MGRCFYLKPGKSRGYVDGTEITGAEGGPVKQTFTFSIQSPNRDDDT